MAITKGAKKAHKASLNKQVFNLRRLRDMKTAVKDIKKFVASGDKTGANKLLPAAYKAIDKATKRGIIKKNTAARKKSRLSSSIKNISA